MARAGQAGAELNTVTDGIEAIISAGATIVTSPVQGSRYAWKMTSASGGGAVSAYARFAHANSTGAEIFYKFDFYTDSSSSIWLCQFAFDSTKRGGIRFTGGTLQLATGISSGVGSASVSVTLNTWHTVLCSFDAATGNGEFYLDGVFVDNENLVAGGLNIDNIYLGQFQPVNSIIHFDNLIVNDTTGSSETGYPNANERLVYLRPNAVMTEAPTVGGAGAEYFRTSGGGDGSGTTANWAEVEEISPDDDTSYVRKNANESNRDWYPIEDIATVGYPAAGDTVNVIAVGGRIGGNGTTDRFFRYLYETAAAGVGIQRSGDLNANANAYFMYDVNDLTTRPPFISYLSGVKGSNLDGYQIGWEADDANARLIKGSTFWLEVSYIPSSVRMLASTGVGT